MPIEPTRRRVLRIFAFAAASAFAPRARADAYEWRGAALGADVSIRFSDCAGPVAETVVARVLDEIERLEAIFSLQRADSELSRLNAGGRLDAPSPDLVHVLSVAARVHAASGGKFDPTVQPLWRFHADWYAADRQRERPSAGELAAARALVGLPRVLIHSDGIRLPAGASLTLNGIAQGHITDRASDILRSAGFRHVLVDLGETRALDSRADGEAWRISLPDGRRVALSDCAIATSAGQATSFAANGDHHIFDPTTGRPAREWRWLSVAHRSATMADALSTGLYCLAPAQALAAVRATPGSRLWGETAQGAVLEA